MSLTADDVISVWTLSHKWTTFTLTLAEGKSFPSLRICTMT